MRRGHSHYDVPLVPCDVPELAYRVVPDSVDRKHLGGAHQEGTIISQGWPREPVTPVRGRDREDLRSPREYIADHRAE